MEAGASGYVPKTRAADELFDVVRRASEGEIVIPSEEIVSVLSHIESTRRQDSEVSVVKARLTSREVEIIEELSEGKSTAEIASGLFISPLTVQSHVKSILSKLGVHSKLEAVTFALRHGLIRISRSA
jgi:DNA-binding NarL/FixJ family response regulator